MNGAAASSGTAHRAGPPLPLPAIAFAALTVAAALTYPAIRPGDAPADVLAVLVENSTQAKVSAVLLLGSVAPLAVWVATAARRLERLGAKVADPHIALAGGVLAGGSLLLSGMVNWTAATVAGQGDAAVTTALTTLGFAAGGVGFASTFALLLAGVAVPSLILRLVPRPLAIGGLVPAGAGVVSLLSALVPALGVLLPVTRFGGLVWLLVVSFTLPLTRRRTSTSAVEG